MSYGRRGSPAAQKSAAWRVAFSYVASLTAPKGWIVILLSYGPASSRWRGASPCSSQAGHNESIRQQGFASCGAGGAV